MKQVSFTLSLIVGWEVSTLVALWDFNPRKPIVYYRLNVIILRISLKFAICYSVVKPKDFTLNTI